MKNKIIVYTLITVMLVNQLPAYGSQSRTAADENKTVEEITTVEENPSAGDTPVTLQEDGETGSETDTSDDGTSPVYEDRTVSESWTLTGDVTIGNLTVTDYITARSILYNIKSRTEAEGIYIIFPATLENMCSRVFSR